MTNTIIGVVIGIVGVMLLYGLYQSKLRREALEFDMRCLEGGGIVEVPGERCNNNPR